MFPERLKKLRKEAGLTQQQVAKKLRVGQNSYSNWEKGIRTPIFPTIEKLAELFNVSTDYLTGKTDIKEKNENNSIETTANVLFRTTVKDLNLTPEQEEQLKKDLNEFIKKRRKAFEDDL
ncbi:DNA-binding transcriptional regulator, XRE-family HTH domain [Streptococcus henryi]|uniref:DNA-binding transcriptional regulator, XRE-family HTH domain n=1 Tax=Streptococcus henryi TaxID=439219 RepID=A0A1G6A067_9STRE|nr:MULTISPECIES: helix-turn-helix transcriptional regulator [Streptococcus]CBZ49414.1 transcriptional regulator [Streptococcus gallolyticus subsp. gallolyticus ATCC BAA-2069]SDB01720.1 DNA-binding transcriptional regulator, XRE-family HTH domain [Streptococcus henryi]